MKEKAGLFVHVFGVLRRALTLIAFFGASFSYAGFADGAQYDQPLEYDPIVQNFLESVSRLEALRLNQANLSRHESVEAHALNQQVAQLMTDPQLLSALTDSWIDLVGLTDLVQALVDSESASESLYATRSDEFTNATFSIAFHANPLNFGEVEVGQSTSLTATLTNTGTGEVTFQAGYPSVYSGVNSDVFRMEATTCGTSLAPGNNCTITVEFAPQVVGSPSGNLWARINESSDIFSTRLVGTAVSDQTYTVAFNANPLNFGEVEVGQSTSLTATLTNTGTGEVTFQAGYPSVYSGVNSDVFRMEATTCGTSLAPGNNCTITVEFAPQVVGSPSGNLWARINESSDIFSTRLVGTAVSDQTYTVAFNANPLNFGEVEVGQSASLTATLTNTGTGEVTFQAGYPSVYSGVNSDVFRMEATTCGTSLAPGNNCTITVEFAPQVVGSPSGNLWARINESSDIFSTRLVGTAMQPPEWQCPFPDDVILEGALIKDSTVVYSACQSISAGAGFIVGSGALVTLEAGTRVTLQPGFRLMASGRLVIRRLQSE